MLALHWSNNGGDDQQDYLQSLLNITMKLSANSFAFYVIHFTNDIGRYSAVLYGI